MEKSIAVVILNYNGKHHLQEYLPNVIHYSPEATIYVIDNASTDDSVSFLKTLANIKLIRLHENYGYAGGYNIGLKEISEPLLCLLNNDVKVTENWLQPILEEFKTNANTGIIQPKILDLKRPDYFEYAGAAGGFIDKYGYPFCRGRVFDTIEKDSGQYNDRCTIFWASGACFFIRNDLFKSLQGFDQRFFAHMEEIDLCWRCYNRDEQIVYIPESKVFHLGGGTLNYQTAKKTYLNFKNSLYTLTKNLGDGYFKILFTRMVLDGIAAIQFLIKLKPEHSAAIFRAHMSFYRHFREFRSDQNSSAKKFEYYKVKSVVWSYFIKGCKKFDCL